MLRVSSWTLRQPRYRAIAVFMAVLAIGCVVAGSFELHRFREKRHGNGVLEANARVAVMPLDTVAVPLTGAGSPPPDAAVRYRRVTATGVYQPADQTFLADQSQDGRQGFLVLTPLRTSAGTLLVGRGFVAATTTETRPADVAAPPSGTVAVTGQLYPTQTGTDRLGRLGHDEVVSVNATQQATRSGQPTFQAYVKLPAGQPGTAGLTALPAPDLSNPTGGAGELQLLSYILQWYAFALLALLAPFFIARNEARDAQRRFLGVDPDAGEFDLDAIERAASSGSAAPSAGELAAGVDRAPALRAGSDVVRGSSTPARQRAERLADRYGRSLGPADTVPDVDPDAPVVRRSTFVAPYERAVPTSAATTPHRSHDAYHGGYNDYLWQLALADGATPASAGSHPASADPSDPDADHSGQPRIIDVVDTAPDLSSDCDR